MPDSQKVSEKTYLVFVYGSLKAGRGNHRLLHGCKAVGEDSVEDHALFGIDCIPHVVPSVGDTVHGEVYEITPKVLQALDWLEGHPGSYIRTLIKTRQGHDAFIYLGINFHDPKRDKKNPTGVWNGYRP